MEPSRTVPRRAFSGKPGNLKFGGAKVTRPNKKASDGIVHVVDTVMDPRS